MRDLIDGLIFLHYIDSQRYAAGIMQWISLINRTLDFLQSTFEHQKDPRKHTVILGTQMNCLSHLIDFPVVIVGTRITHLRNY